MMIDQIAHELSFPENDPDYKSLLQRLGDLKASAVAQNNEQLAKRIWCLEHAVEIQQNYADAFRKIRAARFYDGWCVLEQVELGLMRLRRHLSESWSTFRLDFIGARVADLQSLYPYRIFMSPEIIEIEKKCSICDQPISIRKPCGHKVGEIYKGEYCCRIVSKCEFVGNSFVDTPVQKYSVPFIVDPKTGTSRDHYNYSTVKYLADRWPSPYHSWSLEWTKALHPKGRFEPLRRNDRCPCESGKKYKRCCLRRDGILRPHAQFTFDYPLPEHLQTVELSY